MLNKKTCLSFALMLVMIVSFACPGIGFSQSLMPDFASPQLITLTMNGRFLEIPTSLGIPFLHRETEHIMVPIRFISEQLHWEIEYLPRSERQPNGFYLKNQEHQVKMYEDTEDALLISNQGVSTLNVDSPALIYNNRFYVPLRFITEVMGYKVQWLRYGIEDIVAILPQNSDKDGDLDGPIDIKEKPLDPEYQCYFLGDSKIKGKFIEDEVKFANLLTSYREINNLSPAVVDEKLRNFSRRRALEVAYELIKTGKADHTRPGEEPLPYGENLQYGPKLSYNLLGGYSEELALGAWIKSPSHDINLKHKTEGDYLLGYSQFVFELRGRTFIVGVMNYTDGNLEENQ